MTKEDLIEQLNAPVKNERLSALEKLYDMHKSGELTMPVTGINVNNHIHTTYSFSPYSPTKALYLAWQSGLATAGIMDHDSAAGINEFIEAAKIINFPVTVGVECRVSFKNTKFNGISINNPDQKSTAYMAIHAIPQSKADEVQEFFMPYREKRNDRNKKIIANLNSKLNPYGLSLDFETDILPFSQYKDGGSVTERTIMYALGAKLSDNESARQYLLGIFKSYLVESIYVNADEELIDIADFVTLCNKIGAIPTYAYIGDVGISVTGDKKTQTFEDAFLDELLIFLKETGICAVTYMPARNTDAQLKRIIELCKKYELFQICGEDINSPLQKFICEKVETPGFRHLIDSAWALIGHELRCADGIENGMFTGKTITEIPELDDRVKFFADFARKKYKHDK